MRSKLSILTVLASIVLLCAACERVGIDKLDEHGTTALMRAAAGGDTAEVNRLIASGADVNAEVPKRDMREFIAFANGRQELPTSDIGFTPLLYAAKNGHTHVAGILIAHDAAVEHATPAGVTAFGIAFGRSDVRMMRLLTAVGVRPTAEHLGQAVKRSSPEVVGLLLQRGADPNVLPPAGRGSGQAPLLIAATKRGDPELVRALVDARANVNVRDDNGWTPLRWARDSDMRHKSPQTTSIVGMLEAAGARDDAGARAVTLFDAVRQQNVARVRDALRSGANPNARDNNGVRPLVYAATLGSTDIVAALIAAGAHLNLSAFAPYGPTPIIAAIENGHVDVVKQLLAAGASNDQHDSRGLTPLMAASISRRAEMTALLLGDSARAEPQAFHLAVRNADTSQIRLLLDHGADPNAYRGSALRQAARGCKDRDNTEVIRILLDRGADPKKVTFDNVLHVAAQLCSPQAVALLLQRGADPNARDHQRRTPLFAAAAAGKLENVRALIGAGADVQVRDADGSTVLMHVRDRDVRQELLRAGASMPADKGAGRLTRLEGVKP